MNATAHPAGEARPEQVAEALRDLARLGGFFALDTAAPGTPRQGAPADGRGLREGFAARARAVNDRFGTAEPRVGVSVAHLGLAARLWSPVLACVLVHGILPAMDAAEWAGDGTAVRLNGARGRLTARLPAPADAVHAEVDGALRNVEDGLTVKIAPGLLAGNSASALVGSAAQLQRTLPALRAPLGRLTRDLLRTGRLRGTGRITGPGPAFRRNSCCLLYRAPGGGTCGDCCLTG
ncbi:(2Fe-2S)-binding protein [Streptomyces sp. NPDC088785]|uniref:(2Fe-2S)-binding protein n=1 Tax=Streptomyces sp. NPDC088785 TaxID=3365897 RepID=UPI003816513F